MIHPEKEQPPDHWASTSLCERLFAECPEMGETAVQGYVYDGTLKTGVHRTAGPACWKMTTRGGRDGEMKCDEM